MPYFQKLLISGKPIFYVDCFAGKGKFDDGTAGSPLIALDVREKALSSSRRTDLSGAIQTCFIELNHADDLQKNINNVSVSYDSPVVIPGAYEQKIESILQDKMNQNVFLYIDPYGIKALDSNLFDRFKSFGFSTFEMLINFNSFGFFRDACSVMKVDVSQDEAFADLNDLVEYEATKVRADKQSADLLTNIAGGDYWKKIVEDYNAKKLDGYQAEKRLSTEYKKRLRQDYRYVLDLPIRLKPNQRPKYRMIHTCNHKDGCYLMAANMVKRKDELFLNVQNDGQISLFDLGSSLTRSVEGDVVTREDVKKYIRELMQHRMDRSLTEFMAEFYTEFGVICDFKMIQAALQELENEGELEIIRTPETTTQGRKSTFWEEKGNNKMTIRRRF